MVSIDLRFFSDVLGMRTSLRALLPDRAEGPLDVVYLLHGLSDDETIWTRMTRIEADAWERKLAIVMPNGYRGFYTNNANGPAYADYILKDVIGVAERCLPVKRERSGRSIAGLSMGGYGAIRLALGWPEMFQAAASLSGALLYGSLTAAPKQSSLTIQEFERVFGPSPAGTDHDLLALASRRSGHIGLPRLRVDCGVDDFLIEQNRTFHRKLAELGIGHDYIEYPGSHNWDYWSEHIGGVLDFLGFPGVSDREVRV